MTKGGYLADLGRKSVPALFKALKKDYGKKWVTKPRMTDPYEEEEYAYATDYIIGALLSHKSHRVKKGLLKLLKDDMLGDMAAHTLGWKLKDPSIKGDLIKFLSSKDEGLRYRALETLGYITNKRFHPLVNLDSAPKEVVKAFEDGTVLVRKEAARVLGGIRDIKTLPLLIDALNREKSVKVRENIIGALMDFKAKSSIPALKKAMKKEGWFNRKLIHDLLVKLRDQETLEKMRKDMMDIKKLKPKDPVKVKIAEKYKNAYQGIIKALQDKDPDTRMRAATYLGNSSNKEVLRALRQALAGETNGQAKYEMEKAIKKMEKTIESKSKAPGYRIL